MPEKFGAGSCTLGVKNEDAENSYLVKLEQLGSKKYLHIEIFLTTLFSLTAGLTAWISFGT